MADEQRAKRSRFDQMEPEPKRASRFDRRSRSPPNRNSETRERSPLKGDDADGNSSDPAAAAAAAAAKINAQLQARKAVQHVDVPPVEAPSTAKPSEHIFTPSPSTGGNNGPAVHGEMYMADGDYIQDIEVNDLRNRYMLTKPQTQQMIQKETGADVTIRGKYYPNKSMATSAHPPLYLHVTSTSKSGLEAAVGKINDMIEQELPQLVDERRFRRREREEPERDELGRRKWPDERIPIGLESVPGFNLRAQIVGHGGSYVKHIQQETGCRVQIKGRGSGFLETATGRESDEDMYLHVAGPDPRMVEKGKELCEDLIENVKEQYEEFKSRPPRHHHDRGGYGGDRGGDRGGDHYRGRGHGHGDSSNSPYGRYNSEAAARSPAGQAGTNSPANAADYAAQYAQYYGQAAANGADPYAAYGGYANYVAMYQQYYAQYNQAQGAAPAQPPAGQSSSPPPPPPSDSAPPPPPPSSAAPPPPPSGSPPGAAGGYSAVPPPPGL